MLAVLLSPIGRWAAIGLVLAGLAGAIWVQTLRARAAGLEALRATEAANANAAVIKRMEADADRATEIIRDVAGTLARLEVVNREVIREIVNVPVTTQCVAAPAIGVAVRRLQQWPGDRAGDAGGAKAAGRAGAGLQGAPAAGPGAQR